MGLVASFLPLFHLIRILPVLWSTSLIRMLSPILLKPSAFWKAEPMPKATNSFFTFLVPHSTFMRGRYKVPSEVFAPRLQSCMWVNTRRRKNKVPPFLPIGKGKGLNKVIDRNRGIGQHDGSTVTRIVAILELYHLKMAFFGIITEIFTSSFHQWYFIALPLTGFECFL